MRTKRPSNTSPPIYFKGNKVQTYYAVMTLPINVGGTQYQTNVKSKDYLTAGEARDYGELLLEAGIVIAYRIIGKTDNGNTYFHEYVHYLTEEQKAIPIFPDPPLKLQEEWHAPEITSIDASRHLRETDRPLNELEKLVEELKIHCKNHEKKSCEMWVRVGEETYRLTGGVSTFGSNVVFFATMTGENHF